MVAEEKVASTRRTALPSMSPFTELDVCVILRARCGPARARPRRGARSSLRPRAVTCRRPPPADKQGRVQVHRTGLAVSMRQWQGCVAQEEGAQSLCVFDAKLADAGTPQPCRLCGAWSRCAPAGPHRPCAAPPEQPGRGDGGACSPRQCSRPSATRH